MIWKILLVMAVIVLAFTLFRKKKPIVEETKEVPAVEMKQDPICSTYVEDTTKFKVKYYDQVYYFCSEECKNKFIESKKETK